MWRFILRACWRILWRLRHRSAFDREWRYHASRIGTMRTWD